MRTGKERIIAMVLIMCTALETGGCTEETKETASAAIELIEPVNAASNTEAAAYRNLYDYKILEGIICPQVEEYSFADGMVLEEYMAIPGEQVEKGDRLLCADDTSVEQQITQTEDKLEQLAQDYEDALYALGKQEKAHRELIQDRENAGIVYDAFQTDLNSRVDALNRDMDESARSYIDQLYELDTDYYTGLLEQLRQKDSTYYLAAGTGGTVAAVADYMPGDWIAAEEPVVAVADDTVKILKCEYVSKAEIAKCEDIYAWIGGKRYEVTYQPYDMTEYKKQVENGQVVYSSFLVEDADDEISQGDFAVLAQIYSRREQVLSVPKSAIHKDETGSYVYTVENGSSVYTPVHTGDSDGAYVEILSGLQAGENVLLSENETIGSQSVTVEKADFGNEFEGDAFISYSAADAVKNPVTGGTVYFVEYLVNRFDVVKAGDAIASIKVEGDETAVLEKQLRLQRQQERLADTQEKIEKKKIEVDPRDLQKMQTAIDELQEEISEMQKDYEVTTIYAQTDGVVFWLGDYQKEQTVEKNAVVAIIGKEDGCCIAVNNKNQQLSYGNTVSLEYTDADGNSHTAEGTVVTAGVSGVSAGLKSEYANLRVSAEVRQEILDGITVGGIRQYQNMKATVTAQIRQMPGVLAVPRSAVTEINGKTYVYVQNRDGTVTAQSFIAGGSDKTAYWVLEGLEEGMILCSE